MKTIILLIMFASVEWGQSREPYWVQDSNEWEFMCVISSGVPLKTGGGGLFSSRWALYCGSHTWVYSEEFGTKMGCCVVHLYGSPCDWRFPHRKQICCRCGQIEEWVKVMRGHIVYPEKRKSEYELLESSFSEKQKK